jgi:antitoxin VapB
MTISIRNEQVEKLAREVAVESGENLTEVIIHALEDRLRQLRRNREITKLEQEIMDVSKRCSSLPDLDLRTPDEILGYNQELGGD